MVSAKAFAVPRGPRPDAEEPPQSAQRAEDSVHQATEGVVQTESQTTSSKVAHDMIRMYRR